MLCVYVYVYVVRYRRFYVEDDALVNAKKVENKMDPGHSGALDIVLELILQLLFPIRDVDIRVIIVPAGAADGHS